jgi:hypothetical protein
MPAPLRIAALMAAALPSPDSPRWRAEMERAIAQGHTAAFLMGTAERLKVPVGSALLSERRMSRAERAEIKAAVARQLRYLDGFDPAGMSEAAVRARAAMYAQAVKQTYYAARWGDWEIPDTLMPGNQACLSNCLCRISVRDNGDGTGVLTREMGGTEHHCDQCPPLVGDHPVKRRAA